MAQQPDNSPTLTPAAANIYQKVVGTFFKYARAVYSTMLVKTNSIASEQANITQEMSKNVVQLLKYAATYPEAITQYHARNVVLYMHSYDSSLSALGYKIRAGG